MWMFFPPSGMAEDGDYSDECLRQVGLFFRDIREEGTALDLDVMIRIPPQKVAKAIYAHMLENKERYTEEGMDLKNICAVYRVCTTLI